MKRGKARKKRGDGMIKTREVITPIVCHLPLIKSYNDRHVTSNDNHSTIQIEI